MHADHSVDDLAASDELTGRPPAVVFRESAPMPIPEVSPDSADDFDDDDFGADEMAAELMATSPGAPSVSPSAPVLAVPSVRSPQRKSLKRPADDELERDLQNAAKRPHVHSLPSVTLPSTSSAPAIATLSDELPTAPSAATATAPSKHTPANPSADISAIPSTVTPVALPADISAAPSSGPPVKLEAHKQQKPENEMAVDAKKDKDNIEPMQVQPSNVPPVQDESAVKEDEDVVEPDQAALADGASTAPLGREEEPPEDESDEEKPLDLAAMNAFEYERVASCSGEALRRYEQYRRSDLKNPKVKRILLALNPSLAKVNEPYIIAIKGLAKLFVGDVTETALKVKRERGDTGALQPAHLREAFRRLRSSGIFPSTKERSVSFM